MTKLKMLNSDSSTTSAIIKEFGIDPHVIASMITSAMASVIVYLNRIKNGAGFRVFNFIVNILIACLVAYAVDQFVEAYFNGHYDKNYEKAAMVIIGISANKILEIVEHYSVMWLERRVQFLTEPEKSIIKNHE